MITKLWTDTTKGRHKIAFYCDYFIICLLSFRLFAELNGIFDSSEPTPCLLVNNAFAFYVAEAFPRLFSICSSVYTGELFCQAVLTFLCVKQQKNGFIKPFYNNIFLFAVVDVLNKYARKLLHYFICDFRYFFNEKVFHLFPVGIKIDLRIRIVFRIFKVDHAF